MPRPFRYAAHAAGRQLCYLSAAVMWFAALAAIMLLMPVVEEQFLPVVDPQVRVAVSHPRVNGTVAFRLAVNKLRSCPLQHSTWFTVDKDGTFERGGVERMVPRPWTQPPTFRPAGRQLSEWLVARPGTYFAVLLYQCLPFWTTPGRLGPIVVP